MTTSRKRNDVNSATWRKTLAEYHRCQMVSVCKPFMSNDEEHNRVQMAKWKREQEQRDDRNEWGRTQMKKHKSFIGELKQVTPKLHCMRHALDIGTGPVLTHGMQDGVPAPVQIRRPITWIPGHVVDERHDTKAIPANNVVRLIHGRHPIGTMRMHLTRPSLKQLQKQQTVVDRW